VKKADFRSPEIDTRMITPATNTPVTAPSWTLPKRISPGA